MVRVVFVVVSCDMVVCAVLVCVVLSCDSSGFSLFGGGFGGGFFKLVVLPFG